MTDAQKYNVRITQAVNDIDEIINQHDPEVDVPIKDGVWDRLDKLCKNQIAAKDAKIARLRDRLHEYARCFGSIPARGESDE